jgi:hypothetical protein
MQAKKWYLEELKREAHRQQSQSGREAVNAHRFARSFMLSVRETKVREEKHNRPPLSFGMPASI